MAFGRPLGTGVPSLEAANQVQIEDLVQRNRTLEHTIQRLTNQVSAEVDRGKAAVQAIQAEYDTSQRQWKEGCEDLLGSYRIIQKRLELELEKERRMTLQEMGVSREEKLQRMQRDFKIKLFQLKEEELERKLEEVEEYKAAGEETYDLALQKFRDKCADLMIELKETRASLAKTEKEKAETESELDSLRGEHANLGASKETFKSKIDRLQLQLDGMNTRNTQLQHDNDDLKRTNADITRQLEKWQSLDTKEGAEAENERRKRVALEQELRTLKEEFAKREQKLTEQLEREKKRVEKMKATTSSWGEETQNRAKQLEDATKQLAKSEKQIAKLKSDLEAERARVRPASPQKPSPPSPLAVEDVEEVEEIEEDEDRPPPKKRGASIKPDSKRGTATKPGLTKKPEVAPASKQPGRQIARKSTGGKPPRLPTPTETTPESDGEVEEISHPGNDQVEVEKRTTRKKGKAKAKDVEVDEEEAAPTTQKRRGKRKATDDDEAEPEVVEPPARAKRGARAGSQAPSTARAKSKPASRAPSRQPTAKSQSEEKSGSGDDDEVADEAARKKKKRKINIFTTNDKGTAAVFANFGDKNGLGIPDMLSPLKEGDLVPQRSTSSSVIGSSLGTLGNLLRGGFTGGRR